MTTTAVQTHEAFIQAVRDTVCEHADLTDEERATLKSAKLVYGVGRYGQRGVTIYQAWQNGKPAPVPFVEICAMHEESLVQLAGTTIHELGHVLAGWDAGHRAEWKSACARLGLRCALAGGQRYGMSQLPQPIRWTVYEHMRRIGDGNPHFGQSIAPRGTGRGSGPRPCSQGYGTQGGQSRGTGSGSRLIKCVCTQCGYTARITRKWIEVGTPTCPCGGSIEEEK